MSLFENALKLLRRPVAPAADPQPRRKNGTVRDDDPVNEPELTEALAQLQAERQTAEATLSGAAERREGLLLQPESDEEIFRLARQIDSANLTLERLDRIEPDLRQRLGEVRFHARGARWVTDRDAAAAAFTGFTEAIEQYERARREWAGVFNALAEKWPTAPEIAPRMPALTATSSGYAAELERFQNVVIMLAPPPQQQGLHSLAGAIDYARKFGHAPEAIPPDWLEEIERAIANATNVQTLVGTLDSEGRPVAKGSVITMSYDDAARAVTSGRARYCD